MALSPDEVELTRRQCPVHLQGEVVSMTRSPSEPREAVARLKVVRSFRGSVEPGTELDVPLTVHDPAHAAPGDFEYHWESLSAARYLEVCLTAERELPYNSCSEIIEAPTAEPLLALAPLFCPACGRRQDVELPSPPRSQLQLSARERLALLGGWGLFAALMLFCVWMVAQAITPHASWVAQAALGALAVGAALLLGSRVVPRPAARPVCQHD